MKDIWERFKELTGYNQVDVANNFGVARAYISKEINNTSFTHKSAVAFWICAMLDRKIEELENNISEMKRLRSDIYRNTIKPKERDSE